MKKIGILFGQEDTFPWAFIDRVNQKIEAQGIKNMMAEAVSIDAVEQGNSDEYAVIIDRISQDVPFYRAYLKNAAITGTVVINNPFWWSADEKFFNNALAKKIGVPVPETFILPTAQHPEGTDENSFRNLKYPFDWERMFKTVGFPAYMKPHDGGGWKSVYRVENPGDLWAKHNDTGNLVMMLQEEIKFEEYFRCYVLGTDQVHIMQYEPRNPHHLRYVVDGPEVDKKLLALVEKYCIKLNKALGYDFNTVEFAVRDGVPYAIDFCNPAPDADIHSVGEDNFEWIVENAANLAIKKAKAYKKGKMNLTWGTFVSDQFKKPATKKPAAKKTVTKKTTKAKK
jgi:glutathione synthase/RimK-type ligase-like ATP-grasp enzyme